MIVREADPTPKDLRAALVRAAEKTREWVERRIETDALDIARLYQESRGTMIDRLRYVYDNFLGQDTTFLRARTTMGAQALDNAITRTITELAETISTQSLDSLADLLSVQRPTVNRLIGRVLDAKVHEIPPAKNQVLQELTTSTVGGGTFFDRVFAMSDDLKTKVTSTVRSSLLNGDDFETAREKIHKAFGVDKLRAPRGPAGNAVNIYRNEARRQWSGLMRDIAREQGALEVWWATLDERTTPGCAARHGRAINELGDHPPRHYNCRCTIAVFPGETDLSDFRAEGTAWLSAHGYSRRHAETMESFREAEWDEEKHPRDDAGKFSSTGGGGNGNDRDGDRDGAVVYHGTASPQLDGILKEGLLASKSGSVWSDYAKRGKTYVTTDLYDAWFWASSTALKTSSEEPVRTAILEVRIPGGEVSRLTRDTNMTPTSKALALTGRRGSEKEFSGDIKPSWIKRVWVSKDTVALGSPSDAPDEWDVRRLAEAARPGTTFFVAILLDDRGGRSEKKTESALGWAWGADVMQPAAYTRVKPRPRASYAVLSWTDVPALLVGRLTPEWFPTLAHARVMAQPDHVLIASDGSSLAVACEKGWLTLVNDAPGVWIPVPGGTALDAPDGPSWNQPRKRLSQYLIGRWPAMRTVTFPTPASGESYAGTFITPAEAAMIARGDAFLADWPVASSLDDLVSHVLNRGTGIGSLVFAVARVRTPAPVADSAIVDEHDVDVLVDFTTGRVLYARERFGPQVGMSPYTRVAVACLEPSGRVWAVRPRGLAFWTLPGGHIDGAESYAQAAQREAREEAGLDVTILRTLGTLYRPWSNTVVLLAQRRGATHAIATPDEIDAASLVTLDDLADDEHYFLARVLVQPSHLATARVLEEWDEEKHPRDDQGRWATTGGGGAVAASAPDAVPRDEWGKELATKLAHDFEDVKPDLDTLVKDILDEGEMVTVGAGEWDSLSSSEQQQVEDAYVEKNSDDFYNSELESWQENVGEEAAQELADDRQWWAEKAKEFVIDAETGERWTDLDPESLAENLIVHAKGDAVTTRVEDDRLKWGRDDPSQLDLPLEGPGAIIHPGERWKAIADEWKEFSRDESEAQLEKMRSAMVDDPPDYLQEQANESAADAFSNLDNDEKYEFAKDVLQREEKIAEPEEWKPFEDGADYDRTRALVHSIASERYTQLLQERGIRGTTYESMSKRLWDDWKSAPSTRGGELLRVATEKEFGARARVTPKRSFSDNEINETRAYVRATWEASQYALAKANVEHLVVYRGDMRVLDQKHAEGDPVPELTLKRDALQSTTSKLSVANEWGGIGEHDPFAKRVVLRIQAPRTAVLSLPVFGQNVHDEQEVVLMGTAWSKWDAYFLKAPMFEQKRIAASEADSEERGMADDDTDDTQAIDLNAGPHWLYGKGAPYEVKPVVRAKVVRAKLVRTPRADRRPPRDGADHA